MGLLFYVGKRTIHTNTRVVTDMLTDILKDLQLYDFVPTSSAGLFVARSHCSQILSQGSALPVALMRSLTVTNLHVIHFASRTMKISVERAPLIAKFAGLWIH